MTPAQWRQIEDLYQALQDSDEGRREELLAQADPEVRTAVQRMLDQPSSGSPLDSPAWEDPGDAKPAIGSQLGPYRIEGLLGAGGMGAVFEATDTRLGRRVALKVPNEPFSSRFEKEARYVASLNHPNICTLYDVGPNYLVMELVEGTTLAERMRKGPLRAEQAIALAVQIADALEAAHEKGIIHRDLKPANIRITPKGTVKVLDFGIARRTKGQETQTLTETGTLVGTPGYMSPEQVRGEELDRRSDVFSLGVVLYEMATGRAPFTGPTSGVILEAILNREPPSAKLPPELARIIRKALEKDRNLRYQSEADLRADLIRLKRDSTAAAKRLSPIWASSAVLAVLSVAALVGFLLSRRPATPTELAPVRLTFNGPDSSVDSAAISPDGKYLAYSDPDGVHVKSMSGTESRLLPNTKGMSVNYWTADSSRVFVREEGREGRYNHYAVSLLDENPRPLGDRLPFPDGRHVFYSMNDAIRIEDTSGRASVSLVRSDLLRAWPAPGPNYVAVAFGVIGGASWIDLFRPDTGLRIPLLPRQPYPILGLCWLSPIRLAYSLEDMSAQTASDLWTIELDPHSGLPSGAPVRRTHWPDFHIDHLSATADGRTLSFLRRKGLGKIWIADLNVKGALSSPPRRFTDEDAQDSVMAWTADSRAVLFTSDRSGIMQVYRQDINKQTADVLTSGAPTGAIVRVSPDGQWILYFVRVTNSTTTQLMRIPAGGGEPQPVLTGDGFIGDLQCSRVPGGGCYLMELTAKTRVISLFDPIRGRGPVVLRSNQIRWSAGISPNGKQIALVFPPSQPRFIRLIDLHGDTEREIAVPDAHDLTGLDWTADGSGFFAQDEDGRGGRLLRVDLTGASQVLLSGKSYGIASRDGRHVAIGTYTIVGNVWKVENP